MTAAAAIQCHWLSKGNSPPADARVHSETHSAAASRVRHSRHVRRSRQLLHLEDVRGHRDLAEKVSTDARGPKWPSMVLETQDAGGRVKDKNECR